MQGQKLMAASRGFVRFLTESKVALGYYNWLKNTDTPEEHFYATMASLKVEAIINLNNGRENCIFRKQKNRTFLTCIP